MKESCSTYRWVKWHTNESLRDMTHSYAGHDFFIARRDSHTPGEPQSKLALLTCPNDLRARLCVYVCVRERETERACVCTDDMLKWFEGSSVCLCVCVTEKGRLCVHFWNVQMVWRLARVCLCVYVWVWSTVTHCKTLQPTAPHLRQVNFDTPHRNTPRHTENAQIMQHK